MAKLSPEQIKELEKLIAPVEGIKLDETEMMLENYLQIKYLMLIHEDLQKLSNYLQWRGME